MSATAERAIRDELDSIRKQKAEIEQRETRLTNALEALSPNGDPLPAVPTPERPAFPARLPSERTTRRRPDRSPTGRVRRMDPGERDRIVYEFVKDNPGLTLPDITKAMKLSDSVVGSSLRRQENNRRLIRMGKKQSKNARWRVATLTEMTEPGDAGA